MVALRDLTRLGDDLDRLADALEALDLEADQPSLDAERDRLSRTVRAYLLPRARDREVPLMVVFAGPTGSGKSTLINSLTGLELSVAGPIRPTTTGPIVLTNERRRSELNNIAGIECEVVAGSAPVLDSLVLVDTPDIDSTSTDHRRIAETLIDSADVVVFVTSALRYADAVPWQVLRRAEARGTEMIHVLNRVGSSTRGAVVDFQARLGGAGLARDVLTVPEHQMAAGAQLLPPLSIRHLRASLASLADDRVATAERAFGRVLRTTVEQASELQEALLERSRSRRSSVEEAIDSLSGRVASLDLSPATDGLIGQPAGETPRAVRRWRRASPRGAPTRDEIDDLLGAVESLIIRDVRIWSAERPLGSGVTRLKPDQIATAIAPVSRLAIEGWIDFVRRIASDEAGGGGGLAERVLVATATGSTDMTAARILFGELAHDVVGRARRELTGRVQVIYEQVAAHMTELTEMDRVRPDVTGLRAALASVMSTLAPVDA